MLNRFDTPFHQLNRAMRSLGDQLVMRHHDNSELMILVQGCQQMHDLLAGFVVQIAGWFVR